MRKLVLVLISAVFTIAAAQFAMAQSAGFKIDTIKAPFDDVFQELQDVVINKGLVVDLVGDVGKMIERTADAVENPAGGEGGSPYLNAKYIVFCSAKLTHQAVDANVENLGICPYTVFAYETRAASGTTHVGFRLPLVGEDEKSQQAARDITAFLQTIIDETAAASN